MNSRKRKNGSGIMNINRHSKNSRTRLQVNPYSLFQREKENSEWKLMLQDMSLRDFYPKNKKENRNLLYFYQGQCNQPKTITRYITNNYML